ncbi:hypothetical protein [Trinickia mobilis]|uniref:hypothetical protein n=1 Tax=Trinickia mobilis TaxID=2816356 RepID=UPI001A8C0EA7|nr:hypothetical protein [Trinickia mobilis]
MSPRQQAIGEASEASAAPRRIKPVGIPTIVIGGVAFSRAVEKSDPELSGETLSSVRELAASSVGA